MPQVRYEVVTGARVGRPRRQRRWSGCAGLGLPLFVKPSRLGSSVGISKVSADDELPAAVEAALAHDPAVLVEAAADGIEVECAVIGNDEPVASEPGQVIAHGDWYDYEAKYTEGGMDLVVPAPITAAQRERVRRIAQEAFLRSLVQRAGAGRLLRHRRTGRCC